MAHAWKACWVQALGGSNPPFSAQGSHGLIRGDDASHPGNQSSRCITRGGAVRTISCRAVEPGSVYIRARSELVRIRLLLIIAVPAPVFALIALVGSSHGSWQIAALGQATVVLLAVLSFSVVRSPVISVTATTVSACRPPTRAKTFEISEIGAVMLMRVWDSSEISTNSHLVIRASDGAVLLRVSGTTFADDALQQVIAAIGHPADIVAEPITADDFARQFGARLGWLQSRLPARIAVLAVLALLTGVVVLGLMAMLGLPIGQR